MVETLIGTNGTRKIALKVFDRKLGHFQVAWIGNDFTTKKWDFQLYPSWEDKPKGPGLPVMILRSVRKTNGPFEIHPSFFSKL
jgi:hypothetical protein